jgi:hypothetical protein
VSCRGEYVLVNPRVLCEALDRREQDDLPVEVKLAEAMCSWFLAYSQAKQKTIIEPSVVEALERAARFFARPEKAAALRARLAELGIERGEDAADNFVVAVNTTLGDYLRLIGRDDAALGKVKWLVTRYPWAV